MYLVIQYLIKVLLFLNHIRGKRKEIRFYKSYKFHVVSCIKKELELFIKVEVKSFIYFSSCTSLRIPNRTKCRPYGVVCDCHGITVLYVSSRHSLSVFPHYR